MTNPRDPAPSPDCCQPTADPRIQSWFDRKARRLAATGDTIPLGPVSRRLLAEMTDVAETRPTVLELGCGPGSLTLALLEGGASRATGIDLSPATVEVATGRAAQAGMADRAAFRVGDGAVVPLESHDWVILDKVLCCYADLDALLARSMAAAGRRYVFVVPDSRGWWGLLGRALVWLENATNSIRGRPCPGYVHDIRVIEGRLEAAGFRRSRPSINVRFWYLAVFDRAA